MKASLGNTQERFYKVLLGSVFGNEEKSNKTLLFMYSLYMEINMRMFDKCLGHLSQIKPFPKPNWFFKFGITHVSIFLLKDDSLESTSIFILSYSFM